MDEHKATDPPPARPMDATTLQAEAMGQMGPPGDADGRKHAGPRRSGWQPPDIDELQKGLPHYEIRSLLGCGGMGAVYQGWQKSLDRLVAIKILNKELEKKTDDFLDRFRREARTLARLDHPGIVAVYDAGETPDGMLFFVMEYVHGTDVQKMLAEQGRLTPERAIEILKQVCEALAYAHQRGVVHRDIKPSNIMVNHEGRVKVADFGLVKVAAEDSTSPLTRPMMVMGTPDFMAPEAMEGMSKLDHRADLYALGVMLYAMLTGQIPRGRFETPSRCVPGLDVRFDVIVDEAMQRDPERRYASAIHLCRDLEAILGEGTPLLEAGEQEADKTRTKGARPDVGPLVVKMCNRTREYEQFLNFFAQHSQRSPGVPQVVFVRGWERERLDSLVARLCGTTLRRHAERIGGVYHGAFDERELVEWPTTDTAEARCGTLLHLLFDLYDCPAVPPEPGVAARTLTRLAKERRYPLVVFQFQIQLRHWNGALLSSIELFLRFWDEIGQVHTVGDRPQFLIFVHLVYPEFPGLPGWLGWLLFRPKRIERELSRLLAGRHAAGDPAAPRSPALLLRELEPVERNDVIQWFKRHRIMGDSMKVWQGRCQEIFGSKLKLPMMDIEDALLAIYEQHLEKRSAV